MAAGVNIPGVHGQPQDTDDLKIALPELLVCLGKRVVLAADSAHLVDGFDTRFDQKLQLVKPVALS